MIDPQPEVGDCHYGLTGSPAELRRPAVVTLARYSSARQQALPPGGALVHPGRGESATAILQATSAP